MAVDAETREVLVDPLPARARGDRRPQAEPTGVGEVGIDAGQEALGDGRLAVIQTLQRGEFLSVERLTEPLAQVDDGVEAGGRRADDGEPLLARQLLAMLAIDALPRLKDRTLGIDDEAIEVEDDGVQRFFWKNSRMRRSISARSFSERGICRSFG